VFYDICDEKCVRVSTMHGQRMVAKYRKYFEQYKVKLI